MTTTTDHDHDTDTDTDTTTDHDREASAPGEATICEQLRNDDPDSPITIDARKLNSYDTMLSDLPPELEDKHTLAALYYGGCEAAPRGLSQSEMARYLGVGRTTVTRRMQAFGIHPPEAVVRERSCPGTTTPRSEWGGSTDPREYHGDSGGGR